MKLNGWVNVKKLLESEINTWMTPSVLVPARPRMPWYLLSDLIRYRSSVPHMRKAVADALLLWSRGGFGEMTAENFRSDVLLPANAAAKDEEHEAMRERRRERKRQRAAARTAARQATTEGRR